MPWEVASGPTWWLLLPHVLVVIDRAGDEPYDQSVAYLLDRPGATFTCRAIRLPLWESVYQRRMRATELTVSTPSFAMQALPDCGFLCRCDSPPGSSVRSPA
jgi:hypothetical protein